MFVFPVRHNSHLPQERSESSVTDSPTRVRVTFAPTSTTTPAVSCPITKGGIRRPVEPSNPCTSLPQMPQARTCTSTSSGPTAGRSSDASSSFLYSVSTSACIVRQAFEPELPPHVSLKRLKY